MINIGRLQIHLPVQFQHRATSITRLVGELLATRSVTQDMEIDSLSIKTRPISGNPPDAEIAQLIANQIVAATRGTN